MNNSPFGPEQLATAEKIRAQVATTFKISVDEMDGESKAQFIAHPRLIAMYLIREKTGMAMHKIAALFKKNRAVTERGCARIEKWEHQCPLCRTIKKMIGQKDS